MCLFRKRVTTEKNLSDADLIKQTAGTLKAIGVLLQDAPKDLRDKYDVVQHLADFVSVSPASAVIKFDKKLLAMVEDLKQKIASGKITEDRILVGLKELEVAYADREAIYFKSR